MDRLAASNAQDIIEYACSVNTCVLTVSSHTRSMRYVLCSVGSTDEALAMLCSSSTNVIFIWSISLITTERTSFHRLISVSCRNCCRSSSCIHSSCDFGKSLQGNASQQLVNIATFHTLAIQDFSHNTVSSMLLFFFYEKISHISFNIYMSMTYVL